MELSVDERVSLILTKRTPPAFASGRVVRQDGLVVEIALASAGPALAAGDAIVLDFEREDLPLAHGQVVEAVGGRVEVRIEGTKARDLREFPRIPVSLELRYRVTPDEEALEAWVEAGDATGDSPWRSAAPRVDFSPSGLAFELAEGATDAGCGPGELLLVEMGLPGADAPIRAGARVVRIDGGRIAIDLTDVAAGNREALLKLTNRLLQLPGE